VFDIADLYKAEVSIPIAFDIAAREVAYIGAETRRAIRDHMKSGHFLDTCVHDIKALLQDGDITEYGPDALDTDVVMLWDGADGAVSAGIAYSDEPDGYDDFDDDAALPDIDDLIRPEKP
jgi:CRISP-associated protein Cas1